MNLEKINIAIVTSAFNGKVTQKLREGALSQLQKRGIKTENIKLVEVPGAIEIPFAAKMLAKTKRYQAIICLGAVIRGETGHYDYVCQQVSYGCQKVMLECELPVVFGVLTTNNEQQAFDRAGGKSHSGIEAADVALTMISFAMDL